MKQVRRRASFAGGVSPFTILARSVLEVGAKIFDQLRNIELQIVGWERHIGITLFTQIAHQVSHWIIFFDFKVSSKNHHFMSSERRGITGRAAK